MSMVFLGECGTIDSSGALEVPPRPGEVPLRAPTGSTKVLEVPPWMEIPPRVPRFLAVARSNLLLVRSASTILLDVSL